jgi:hypothetical protein
MVGNPIANAALIVSQTLASPLSASAINLSNARPTALALSTVPASTVAGTSPPSGSAVDTGFISPTFKMVFIAVLVVTISCGIAELVLASVWEKPTTNQQAAFEAMGFAWKAGLGAILGLLGGKVA